MYTLWVKVAFGSDELDRLETDSDEDHKHPVGIPRAYRKAIQALRAAPDERVLRQMKSFRFEKLAGGRSHQRSIRLNEQWRLILEFQGEAKEKIAVVIAIEDYH